jgi:PAS domain S-box-containing protein
MKKPPLTTLITPAEPAILAPVQAQEATREQLLVMIQTLDMERQRLAEELQASRQSAQGLRHSQEHYRTVVEHVDEGVVVIRDQKVVYANARAAAIVDISTEEIKQVGFLHRIHPDDQALVLERQRQRLAGENVPSRYELRVVLSDGAVRWIGISVTLVPWDGEPAFLVFFSDIDRRRALEKNLRDSLQERETILENSVVGIAFLSPNGGFRWANREMAKLFGLGLGASVPTDWSRLFVSHDDYQRVVKEIRACMRAGHPFQQDLQMRRLDGTLFWVAATGKPVSALDKAQGTVWAVMDITPRKALEVALAKASSEREAIFNSALVGITFNVMRRMQWVNDKYTEMTGYSREELVGSSTRIFYLDDQTHESDGKTTRATLVRDGVYVGERLLRRKNGETFWAQLSGRCVFDRDPDAGVIWTLLDITERRNADNNIRAALAREKELNDLRSRFVSMTSHEFRTPLSAILSASELLRDYQDRMPTVEKKEILANIGAGVQRMTSMLDRVLLLGQVDAHMLEFRPQQIDLIALCQSIVAQARAQQPKATCTVTTRFPPSVPARPFDPKLLRHVLENLLSNAIKYSVHGGLVTFSVTCEATRTVFKVTDQGIGIPPDEMPHLFESFHRASNVGAIQGTGLGLAIVKNAVELHGGQITVQSELGHSTCFTVTI